MEEVCIILDIHHKGSTSKNGNHLVSDANADDDYKDQPFLQVVGSSNRKEIVNVSSEGEGTQSEVLNSEIVDKVNSVLSDSEEEVELDCKPYKTYDELLSN
ncbi:conserved hypothetical protein [Ricinus communis]|uniref:Uncharacterized protein n=1 Tax=Ricinus communis TaxID=3988 RepID=B9SQ46_RICCO|nr:conserved hypothetical protein [Ricinus communis]